MKPILKNKCIVSLRIGTKNLQQNPEINSNFSLIQKLQILGIQTIPQLSTLNVQQIIKFFDPSESLILDINARIYLKKNYNKRNIMAAAVLNGSQQT